MATRADTESTDDVIKSGFLTKEGGTYRNWRKRHFVLKGTTLSYYKNEGDPQPKGSIDLTTGRGVRAKKETQDLEWPKEAKANVSFGIAVEGRTYYIYGTDPNEILVWRKEIKAIIETHGSPDSDWESDISGLPEPALSKVIRGVAKMGTEITKAFVKDSGLVDEDTANVLEGVAEGVENQANADYNTSITDRAKMAVGDTAGVVGDNVDNDVVGVTCDVVKEQAEADDDTTVGQRLGMAAGTTLQGTSGMVDDDVGQGVMNTAGGIIHDQATADTEATVQERLVIGVGSVAAGVGDSVDDDGVKAGTKAVTKTTEKMAEDMKKEREKKEKEEEDVDEDESEDQY